MKMKKKIIVFLAGLLAVISCATVSSGSIQAKSYASRHHLSAYNIPSKYRGNWKDGSFRLHVTSRKIWGTYVGGPSALTYKTTYKQFMKLPGVNSKPKTILVWHSGKWLVWAYPSSQPSSMRRSGSHLIVQIDTWKLNCHRY